MEFNIHNLKRVRNNFRAVWIEWASRTWNELHSKYLSISCNAQGMPRNPYAFTSQEEIILKSLSREQSLIWNILDASICLCSICGKGESDMTFNPHDKEWYCTECYDENQEFYKDSEWSFLFP